MSSPAFPPSYAKRLPSLDVFRGLTLAVMVLVNNIDSEEAWNFTQHSVWNGFTVADLVFPGFLFAAGTSLVFALESRMARGVRRAHLALHLLRRAAILFAIGLGLNALPFSNLAHWRVYGVLQRIALCYLLAGLIYLADRRVWSKLAICAALLVGYWGLLCLVPVPGAGVPGRDVPLLDMKHNLASWLDRQLLPGHLYAPSDPPTHDVHDPEGLLSTLPAIATTLLGMVAGIGLRNRRRSPGQKTRMLALAGVLSLLLGYAWSLVLPLNKNLWTSSYALVAAGWSLAVLALLHWLMEEKGWQRGWSWPWLVFGANSIVCYVFSELLTRVLNIIPASFREEPMAASEALYRMILAVVQDPAWTIFLYGLLLVALSFVPVWWLWRRRIFVKI